MTIKFAWDTEIKCERYHGTVNASICIARHRVGENAGCQKCLIGAQMEEDFGAKFDLDTDSDKDFIKRIQNTLARNGYCNDIRMF